MAGENVGPVCCVLREANGAVVKQVLAPLVDGRFAPRVIVDGYRAFVHDGLERGRYEHHYVESLAWFVPLADEKRG